jgi:energy-converting hydrogenase Eha subunit G
MILIAVVLVSTGVVSTGFLGYAVACLGMMFVMMKMMDRGGMKM